MHGKLPLAMVWVVLIGLAFASPLAASSHHQRTATVDFSAIGAGNVMPADYFLSDGLVFAPEQCDGSSACHPWFVGWIQGDDAIGAGQNGGPITIGFVWPVSALSVDVAPVYQFKAAYTLTAFDARGRVVGRKTVIESQDTDLPDASPFGYFNIGLGQLMGPACSFAVRARFLAASNPANRIADFGMDSIHLRFQNTSASDRCKSS